mgnify:CR=1 FL=1
MEKNNEEGEYLSQAEIDAIIDEIIENEPIPAVKEHLIKYEKEYRRKRDQQKLEKYQLNEENKTYDKINHPHDKTVRLMLSNSQEAANLINLALKTDFVKANQIEQYKSSFITKAYKNRESDIVYKDLKNKGIYYLIEHQSKQDKMMAVRITEYSLEIIRSALDLMKKEKREEFPTVIPIVLYTGKGKWKIPQSLEDVQVKLADINLPSIGSYKLIDINTYSDDDLIKAKGALPKVLLMEKNSNHLEKGIKQIEKCNFTKEEREIISVYITNIIGEINPKLAKEMLENINKNEEEKGMRLGQALVDYYYEGVEKGRTAGNIEGAKKTQIRVIKRMLKENFDKNIIKKIANATDKDIEEARMAKWKTEEFERKNTFKLLYNQIKN